MTRHPGRRGRGGGFRLVAGADPRNPGIRTDGPRLSSTCPRHLSSGLLDIATIYHEPDVGALARGAQVLGRFPDAERVEVPSHQDIPGLYGNEGNVRDWVQEQARRPRAGHEEEPDRATPTAARATSSRRRRRTAARWPAPTATCPAARGTRTRSRCSSTSSRSSATSSATWRGRAPSRSPTSATPSTGSTTSARTATARWTPLVSDNVRDLVDLFARTPDAKASFATKLVNRELLGYDPRGGTRVRFSLMPDEVARVIDVRTSRIAERIAAHRRLRRGRLRGAPQLQPGDRAGGLARGVGAALRPDRRRHRRGGEAAARLRGHLADAQRRSCTRSTWAGTPGARSCSGAPTSRRPSAARAARRTSATAPAGRAMGHVS